MNRDGSKAKKTKPLTPEELAEAERLIQLYRPDKATRGCKTGHLYRGLVKIDLASKQPTKLSKNQVCLQISSQESSPGDEYSPGVYYHNLPNAAANLSPVLGFSPRKLLHQFIMQVAGQDIPPGYEIHHINANSLDNRRINLAVVPKNVHLKIHSFIDRQANGSIDGIHYNPARIYYLVLSFCFDLPAHTLLRSKQPAMVVGPCNTRGSLTSADLIELGISSASARLCRQILEFIGESGSGEISTSSLIERFVSSSSKSTVHRALCALVSAKLLDRTTQGRYIIINFQ